MEEREGVDSTLRLSFRVDDESRLTIGWSSTSPLLSFASPMMERDA